MKFTVTYRKQDGSLAKEIIDADDRAAAVAACRARGIVPKSVTEGGSAASPSHRPAWVKGAVAGVLVVIVAVAAWFLFASKPAPEKPKPAPVPKAVAPKPAPKIERPVPPPKPVAVETNAVKETPKKKGKYEGRLNPGDPGWDPKDHPYVLVYTNKPPENPEGGIAHRNGTEQVLDWIFSCKLGDPPGLCPTLPGGEVANIAAILEQGAEMKLDDSDETREHKAIIAAAKRELKEYVEKGGDPQHFINFYHSQLMNYHQQYLDAQSMVLKAARETPELAAELVKKVNARLAEKGIKPVMISKKMRERLGIPQE